MTVATTADTEPAEWTADGAELIPVLVPTPVLPALLPVATEPVEDEAPGAAPTNTNQ